MNQPLGDEKETTTRNPLSYVAWKEKAERLEAALTTIRNITDGHHITANRRDRIYQLSNDAISGKNPTLIDRLGEPASESLNSGGRDIFKLEKKIHDLTHVLSENGKLSLDDFNVRNVLLECLALLDVENIAAADECRTMDVAETLKAKIIERNVLVQGLNAALLLHIKTELGL